MEILNKVGGQSSPSPDYPQDIHVVTGNNTVSVGSTNYPINLGSLELCKIGDYQDYLYKENGNWYKYGAIGKVVFDGTEENINYQSSYQRINIPFNLQTQDWGLLALTLCNYYTMGNTETVDGSFNINRTTLMFKNNSLNSLNEWKTWLSTHNTSVYYILDTPIITQITDTTLISQLEAIYEHLQLTKGINNITVTPGDLAPYIKLSYMQDLPGKLNAIESRISALEE